jgi:hypothetical protein
MRKFLLVTVITLASLILKAQSNSLIKKNFIAGADMVVTFYDYINGKEDSQKVVFPTGWKFRVVDIKNNKLILKQWETKNSPFAKTKLSHKNYDSLNLVYERINAFNQQQGRPRYASSRDDDKFYSVDLDDFTAKADPYFAKGLDFTFGVMTIPIKLRSGNEQSGHYFNYDEKFNVGICAGLKYNFNSRKNRSLDF